MGSQNDSNGIKVQDLWAKYEDVAMHFNDLLMRIRVQSVGAVAAISTLVGIFAKDGGSANMAMTWLVAAGLFSAVTLIWIAIFCLDFFYYNRLLIGAVAALTELERATAEGTAIKSIQLSTIIEREFTEPPRTRTAPIGVLLFYGVVFLLLTGASAFSLRMHYLDTNHPSSLGLFGNPKICSVFSAASGPPLSDVLSLRC